MINTKKITLLAIALSCAQVAQPLPWTRAIKHKTNEIVFSIKEFFNSTFNKAKRSPGTTTSITANGVQLVALAGLITAVVIQSARINGKNNSLTTNQTTFNTQRTDLEAQLQAQTTQRDQLAIQVNTLQQQVVLLNDNAHANRQEQLRLQIQLDNIEKARDRAEALVIQMQEEKRAMIEQQACAIATPSKNKKDKKEKSPRKSQDKQASNDSQNPATVVTTGDVEKVPETDPATQAETEKVRFGFIKRLVNSPKK